MPTAFDVQSGTNLKVEIGTYTGVQTPATDFAEVPEVSSFAASGVETTVISVPSFNSGYTRKIAGSKNIPDISLQVSYIADNTVHKKLDALVESSLKTQIKLSYFQDSTRTTGFYVIYAGFVSKSDLGGDRDAIISRTYTFTVDGKAIGSGLLP